MSEVLPYASAAIAVGSFLFTIYRTQKADTKELEHRITALEENKFTQIDRECLHVLDMKMDLFWSIIQKEFPKFLKQNNTPTLDILLEKASKGVDNLSPKEVKFLEKGLNDEYKIAVQEENSGRALAIAFFSVILKYAKNNCEMK